MSDLFKPITPKITELKTGTPVIKHGDKYIVAGIGGDFIPNGVTVIPGSDGTDTSDATAVTPSDVSEGLVFYNAEGRQVGTMPDVEIEELYGGETLAVFHPGRLRETYTVNMPDGAYMTGDASSVTPEDVTEGLVFYNAEGRQTGTLRESEISLKDGTDGTIASVSAGRVMDDLDIPIPAGVYNTQDADAKASDLPLGIIAYTNTGRIEGTAEELESGAEVTLGQIDADGNFQALAFNGKNASNSGDPEAIEKYYTYNGVLPVPECGESDSGGGSADFYKCAAVDTSAKTWTGYKAVLTEGLYSFQETVTTGLTYTDIIPEIGGIYTDGTNVCIAFLNTGFPEGYVFFNSLSSFDGWDVRGATIVEDDNRSVFQTTNDYEAQSAVITTNPGVPLGNNPFSLSFWFKRTSENGSCWCGIGYGTSGGNNRVAWGLIEDYPGVTYWAHDYFQTEYSLITDTNWHHVVVTYDGEVTKNYIDGSLIWEWQTGDVGIDWEYINVGDPWENYQSNGRYADYYIYPRVLQPFEISQLLKARTV
jgi:hypothetical protein